MNARTFPSDGSLLLLPALLLGMPLRRVVRTYNELLICRKRMRNAASGIDVAAPSSACQRAART
jgi:hypothetical protein